MTAELAEFVCHQLAGDRVRRMFGGWAIYRHGGMAAIVYEGRAYVKVENDEVRERLARAGMRPFQPRPKQVLKSYWEILAERPRRR